MTQEIDILNEYVITPPRKSHRIHPELNRISSDLLQQKSQGKNGKKDNSLHLRQMKGIMWIEGDGIT